MNILVIACFGLLVAAAVLPAAEEQEVEKAERAWAAAVEKSDYAAMQKIYADDMVYAHSTGLAETKAEYLKKLKAGSQKYSAIQIDSLKVKVLKELAIVNAKGRFKGATNGVPFDNPLTWTHVYVKRGGQWVMVAHQSARLQ